MYFGYFWIHIGNVVGVFFHFLLTTTQTVVSFCVKIMSVNLSTNTAICFCATLHCYSVCFRIFFFSTVYFCSQKIWLWKAYLQCLYILFRRQPCQNRKQIQFIVLQIQYYTYLDQIYFHVWSRCNQKKMSLCNSITITVQQ